MGRKGKPVKYYVIEELKKTGKIDFEELAKKVRSRKPRVKTRYIKAVISRLVSEGIIKKEGNTVYI